MIDKGLLEAKGLMQDWGGVAKNNQSQRPGQLIGALGHALRALGARWRMHIHRYACMCA